MCSKGYSGSDADQLTFDCGHNVPYEMFQTQNAAYIAGFDGGVTDRRDGVFIQEKITGFGADFANGYTVGWRSSCYQANISTYCHLPTVQNVLANQPNTNCDDSCQENGIASDKMGRFVMKVQIMMKHDQYLERTANMPSLPSNQHYGECEEDSKGLACDILNDDGTPNQVFLPGGC